ncbi:hypothetical protein [Terrarubrum flagellatum]|uniref:hypothetical protein n=1 Tax=Terrirubrum flagellatum TaxID=2895980 RepID=UPI00314540EA
MSEATKAAPDTVAANAKRGGLEIDDATAARIASAVSPALGAFDCAALRLPMEEEPSGWTRRATEGAAE